MKKTKHLSATYLSLVLFFLAFSVNAQVIVPVLVGASTSGNSRAPQGSQRYIRTAYVITAAEMSNAGIGIGSTFSTLGFSYSVAQSVPTTGSFKIYLQNTSDNVYAKSSNTWTDGNTGIIDNMTLVHDNSVTIPAGTGPWDIPFVNGGAFTYTGEGLYVAFEYQNPSPGTLSTSNVALCNTTIAVGLKNAFSNTTLPSAVSAGTSSFRPCTRLGTSITTPTTAATNVFVSNVTTDEATIHWTRGNGASRAVFVKEGNSGAAAPVDQTSYTANAVFTASGTEIGSTGWHCVFKGNNSSPDTVIVPGLSDGVQYRVMVVEFNGPAGYEKYNTNPATGNPFSFSTLGGNAAPVFTAGSSEHLSVCQNASATDISNILQASDADNGQTLTWSISSGPTQGSLSGFITTASSNSGNVSPSGLTYTPANGYSGADAFDISVSDGTASAIITVNVTVNALPSVNAGIDQDICAGGSATVSASGAALYSWDNGVSNGIAFSPVSTANYTVTGTDGNGCVNTDQITVTVNALPTVNAGMDQAVCSGGPVTLSGSGASSYSWNNGVSDGVAFAPGSTTTYMVTGTDGNGCTNTDDITITVNELPNVSAGADQAVCNGAMTTLSASGASSYVWNNGVSDGVAFTPSSTDVYTVTGTDGNGCVNTDDVTITVNSLPTVDGGPDREVCPGSTTTLSGSGALSYTWNNFAQNGVPFFPTAPSLTYTVTGTDANGCTNTDQVVVSLHLPQISPSGFVNVCKGSTTTLTAPPGAATYTWKKNGVKVGGKTNTLTASAAGNYTVNYLDPVCGNNASLSATVNVIIPPSKPVVTPASVKICDGETATLSGPAGFDYQWYDQSNTIIPGATTQDYVSSSSVTVRLATSILGCASVKSNPAKIVVNPLPLGTFYVKKVNKNGSLILTAHQTNATYVWYLNGSPIPGANSINLTATQSGVYKLEVTKKGTLCVATSADTSITVNYTGVREAQSYPGLEEETEELISVYPNPSTGIFRIQSEEPMKAVVRDIQGRVVAQKDDATEIDLSAQTNGIYLLQLFNSNNELVKTERLSKQ